MAYDASDRKHVAKAERASRRDEVLKSSFIRTAMASVEGRAWILGLLERCNVFGTPFTANANATAFNCGIQNVGHWVLGDIMAHAPDSYLLMMREQNARSSPSPSPDEPRGNPSDGNGRDSGPDASAGAGDYDPYAARDAEVD